MVGLIVNKDIANKLYEIGFDEKCMLCYNDNKLGYVSSLYGEINEYDLSTSNELKQLYNNIIAAPFNEQVLKWFREKYNIFILIEPKFSYPDNYINGLEFHTNIYTNSGRNYANVGVRSYEESIEYSINQVIQIIEENE